MNKKFENLNVFTYSFSFALLTKLMSSFSNFKSARPSPSTSLKTDFDSSFIIGSK